jgi:hypothetical protein
MRQNLRPKNVIGVVLVVALFCIALWLALPSVRAVSFLIYWTIYEPFQWAEEERVNEMLDSFIVASTDGSLTVSNYECSFANGANGCIATLEGKSIVLQLYAWRNYEQFQEEATNLYVKSCDELFGTYDCVVEFTHGPSYYLSVSEPKYDEFVIDTLSLRVP